MSDPLSDAWRRHLLTEPAAIHAALAAVHSIAVLGIKPADTDAPAFYVPEYAQRAGYRVIPVPVYYPDMLTELGERVLRESGSPSDDRAAARRRLLERTRALTSTDANTILAGRESDWARDRDD